MANGFKKIKDILAPKVPKLGGNFKKEEKAGIDPSEGVPKEPKIKKLKLPKGTNNGF